MEFISVGTSLLSPVIPGVVDLLKGVVVTVALPWHRQKATRADECTLGLFQRLERVPHEYVRKDEFRDLLEDALVRYLNQPDEVRRRETETILLNSAARPSTHVLHKLFIRLADESPMEALRILTALSTPRSPEEIATGYMQIIANRSQLDEPIASQWTTFLMYQGLYAMNQSGIIPLEDLLTPIGKEFAAFRRG